MQFLRKRYVCIQEANKQTLQSITIEIIAAEQRVWPQTWQPYFRFELQKHSCLARHVEVRKKIFHYEVFGRRGLFD
jgi:hypothetical protein